MAQSVRQARRTSGAKKAKRMLSSGQVHVLPRSITPSLLLQTLQVIRLLGAVPGRLASKILARARFSPSVWPLNRLSKPPSKWGCKKLTWLSKAPAVSLPSVQCNRWGSKSDLFRIRPRWRIMAAAPKRNAACNCLES
jgi:hypothetical protein